MRSAFEPQPSEEQLPDQTAETGPESWLNLHASELVIRLQQWALELESRELRLDAREAEQTRRERSFRIRQASQPQKTAARSG